MGLCIPQKWISHTQKPVPRHKKKSIWSNQSYKIFKIKNSAEFSELNYCITLKLFDGIEFFLCLGIGFWVWEIHFWGLQSPTTILIAFFSYPEAHISEGSLWIISKFRILKSMHKMIHKTIDGCSGTKSFSWVCLCRPVTCNGDSLARPFSTLALSVLIVQCIYWAIGQGPWYLPW